MTISKINKLSFRIPISRNRNLLYVGGLLFVLILAAFTFFELLQLRLQAEARLSATSQSLVRSLELMFEGQVNTIDATLFTASKPIEQLIAQRASKNEIDSYLKQIQNHLPFNITVRATNASGEVIYGEGTTLSGSTIADRDYFIKLRDDPDAGFEVVNPLIGRVDNLWVWPFARRINSADGSFAGVIFARMNFFDILKMFKQVNLIDSGVFVLRDKDFGLIARHKRDDKSLRMNGDRTMSDAFINAFTANNLEGTYNLGADKSFDGVSRIYSYRKNSNYQFVTLVGLDRDAMQSEWCTQAWISVGLLFGLVLAVLSTVRAVDKNLVRSEQEDMQLRRLLGEQRTMLDNDLVGIVKLSNRKFLWVNKAFSRICGYATDELLGKDVRLLFPDDATYTSVGKAAYENLSRVGSHKEQRQLVKKNGDQFWVDLTGGALIEEGKDSLWILADITELKVIEEQVRHLALYDPLTDLPNRRLLNDRLAHDILVNKRHSQHGALLFIDLDKFKAVNDTYGHSAGDSLLIEVGKRLTSAVRESDTVARVGGDEFVVLISGLVGELNKVTEQVNSIAEKIRQLLAKPYVFESHTEGQSPSIIEHHCTASIGAVVFPQESGGSDDYLKLADSAMYVAKNAGANTVRFYTPK